MLHGCHGTTVTCTHVPTLLLKHQLKEAIQLLHKFEEGGTGPETTSKQVSIAHNDITMDDHISYEEVGKITGPAELVLFAHIRMAIMKSFLPIGAKYSSCAITMG